jgi:broad specificity phosphatase PhoE
LSEVGVEQARRVGAYLAARDVRPARVLVGPRLRHRQTLDALRDGYASGHAGAFAAYALQDATTLAEFDEHAGALVVARLVDQRAGDALSADPTARATAALAAAGGPGGADIPEADRDPKRAYLRAFTAVLRRWSRGEIDVGDLEPWPTFRARVESGLRLACDGLARGDVALVVTSGGPVAAAVGFALGTSDERTMELSWGVANTGVSEFLYSPGRLPSPLMLASYNVTAHLEGAWLTYV